MLPIQLNKDWLKKYWSLLMILVLFHLVVGVVVAANFPQKEFLMGWDSLHPEFNFLLNFKRSLTAVWQDNYGLGALVGHGFASLLPHNIITFFLFFFLPRWAIRAAFVLMMYWLGGLGALLVSRKILHKLFSDKSSVANLIPWLSLTAGGFYLLNLATVQQFYLPLEAFVVHFAFLPWFFLLIEDYLEKPSIKKLFWFGLVSFFGSIQGFIPIVFVALSMISGFFSLLWIGLSKNKKVEFNRWLRLGLVFVLVNAYWVLPVGYYTQANSGDFLSSYNNQLSTPKFLAKSQANGYLPDVAFLKSFLLEGEQPSGLVFEPWLNHLAQTHVEVIGWVLFGLISLGWIYLISSKKFKQHKSYAFSGLIAFGFLAPQVPPFKWVMNFIFNQSDLLAQTFRTAFTKFGLLMAFFYSLFLVFGLVFMVQLIKRILKFDFFQYLLIFAVMIGLMLFGWPVMQGKLFDHQLITAIPDSYFKVMDYFNNQEQGRVVELPVECAKGWYTRPWGYYGSGYMWFGIKQPYLSRTFDVWSQANENFFFEARYALRQPDYQGLDQVLDKYQVRWIFLDPNLEHCKSDKGLLYQKQLDEFLNQDQNYELKEIFSDLALEQPLKIYERTGAENKEVFSHDYVSVLSQPGSISKDWLYHQQTAYIETDAGQIDYPFAEFEAQNQDKQDQMVTIDKEFITLDTELSLDGKLIWPEYSNLEKKLPIIVELEESSEFAFYQIMIKIQGPRLRVNQQTKIEPIVIRAGTTSVENIENLNLFINEQRLTRLSPTEFLGSLSFGITNQLVAYQAGNRNIWWVWSEDQGSLDSYLSQKTVDLKQNDTVTLEIPKIFDQHQFGGYLLAKDMPLPFDCSPKKSEWAKFELGLNQNGSLIRMLTIDGKQCLNLRFNHLRLNSGYIFALHGRRVAGLKPSYRLTNPRGVTYFEKFMDERDNEIKEIFVAPPVFWDDIGYTLELKNLSYGPEQTVNDIFSVEYWFVPYNFISSIRQQTDDFNDSLLSNKEKVEVLSKLDWPLPVYRISLDSDRETEQNLIVIDQAYHSDWQAYQPHLFGQKLEHYQYNNWANAWLLPVGIQDLIIIYWPQIFELIGLGLLSFILVYLYVKR